MKNNLIPLAKDTIEKSDIDQLIVWLKKYPKLTKGEQTIKFEEQWSKFIGTKYSVFVNSGSSANLLMLYALMVMGKISNNKIVVPALSWATDLAPVMQLGLEPILVDCNMEDLSVDLFHLEQIFKQERPSTLLLVSVLGLCPNMAQIKKLCNTYNVILLEDVCESFGTSINNKMLGTFGLMSSFSLYFAHHLSTIEGGMICTNDKNSYEILKMLRAHGWTRDLDQKNKNAYKKKWNISDFNDFYTFYIPGFNFRSTDLQAFLGINQLKKAKKIITTRQKNYLLFKKYLKNNYWMPKDISKSFISNFSFPIIHPKRDLIVENLRKNNIEVRPLICGSMGIQPFYVEKYGKLLLNNASTVDNYGCYIPNFCGLTEKEIKLMCNIINETINNI